MLQGGSWSDHEDLGMMNRSTDNSPDHTFVGVASKKNKTPTRVGADKPPVAGVRITPHG